ncbi:hypothetical protein [Actinophytocola sp.]|uniref:hypothetical protein n=1 Tax=Actinophytocola sp. TaxID=1872138 RepID=UPI0039C8A0B7
MERAFGETRRRAKVIGRFPGETSCISIVWAVLDRASRGWLRPHHDPSWAPAPARPAPIPALTTRQPRPHTAARQPGDAAENVSTVA